MQLCFAGCSEFCEVGALWTGLAALRGLKQLRIDISGCSSLHEVRGLSAALQGMVHLEDLFIDCRNCFNLRGMCQVWKGAREFEEALPEMDWREMAG